MIRQHHRYSKVRLRTTRFHHMMQPVIAISAGTKPNTAQTILKLGWSRHRPKCKRASQKRNTSAKLSPGDLGSEKYSAAWKTDQGYRGQNPTHSTSK